MKREAGAVISKPLKFDVTAPGRQIGEKIDDLLFGQYQKQLADAMLSPKAQEQLLKLKQLSPKSQKFIRQFSTFLTLTIGGYYSEGQPRAEILGPKPKMTTIPREQNRREEQ
jgi:hypothetical protein